VTSIAISGGGVPLATSANPIVLVVITTPAMPRLVRPTASGRVTTSRDDPIMSMKRRQGAPRRRPGVAERGLDRQQVTV